MYKRSALLLRWRHRTCRTPSVVENPVRVGQPHTIFLVHPLSTSNYLQNASPKHDDSKKGFPYKVGFIGAGNMAKAIGFSVLDAGLLSKKNFMVSAPLPEFLEPWKKRGVNTTEDNAEIVDFGDIIFLLAPPQDFDDVIGSLRKPSLKVDHQKCFVSTMVGKTIQFIEEKLKTVEGLKVPPQIVRITPNMPITVGAGCTIIAGDEETDYFKAVQQLMRVSGTCELIPERLMNVCTATSGSGPAYVYLVIEGLADGAVRAGVHRSTAYRLAAQAVIGAGQMVFKTGKHPGQLKDEICSEGGSTIAGVHALEEGGVRCAFINAIVAATKRAEELGSHRQSWRNKGKSNKPK